MRCVEFVGVPGVGKSTLSASVVSSLQRKLPVTVLSQDRAMYLAAKEGCEKTVRSILRLLPETLGERFFKALGGRTYWQQEMVLGYLLANHDLLHSIFQEPLFNKYSIPERKVVVSSLLSSGGLLGLLKESPKEGWVFFDEGILQKSMLFVSPYGTAGDDIVHRYLSRITLPEVVVHLRGDRKVCLERMLGRGKGLTSRLRAQSAEQVDTFLENSMKHWELVTAWLRSNTTIPVLDVGTDRELPDMTAHLAGILEEVIRERSVLQMD